MLSASQRRLLLALQKRKEREARGLFIIEGEKLVREAGNLVDFAFTEKDTPIFREVVSTESPQKVAAVARTPKYTLADIWAKQTVVVLDGVQDPGNVGAVLRACSGFQAGLLLVESAEVTNPKTVRSSAGAVLRVPWLTLKRDEASAVIAASGRAVYRLERRAQAKAPKDLPRQPLVLIAGNEGQGIKLKISGESVSITHARELESLNVGVAVSLVLYELCRDTTF